MEDLVDWFNEIKTIKDNLVEILHGWTLRKCKFLYKSQNFADVFAMFSCNKKFLSMVNSQNFTPSHSCIRQSKKYWVSSIIFSYTYEPNIQENILPAHVLIDHLLKKNI